VTKRKWVKAVGAKQHKEKDIKEIRNENILEYNKTKSNVWV
jgi:hypothetical protein